MSDVLQTTTALLAAGIRDWVMEQAKAPTPKEILRRTFELSFDDTYTWMLPKDQHDERFIAACAAAHTQLDAEHKSILTQELQALKATMAWIQGGGVGNPHSILKDADPNKLLKPNSTFIEIMDSRKKIDKKPHIDVPADDKILNE